MKKKIQSLIVLLCLLTGAAYATSPMINVLNREKINLNGNWKYIIDPYENGLYNHRYEPYDQKTGSDYFRGYYADKEAESKSDLIEYNFDKADELQVPGDWNSQNDELLYYEGTIWYRKEFDVDKLNPDKRYFLYFGAANYEANVYLNAEKLGKHVGGFTPFSFEVTDHLKPNDNSLVVMVDNKRYKEAVPTVNTDWWNYGGLTRGVYIVEVEETYIHDYQLQLDPDDKNILKGHIQLAGTDFSNKVTVEIPELGFKKTFRPDNKGFTSIEVDGFKADLWHPDNPKLYELKLRYGNEMIEDRIGFRTIKVKGSDILLNGEEIFLRGVCIHEENPFRGGRAYNEKDARILLNWVKDMNGNFARLAHYPHNEYMSRVADELGVLLWEEIPVYWTIEWTNQETYQNAENQLKDMINRDKNRASVIIWSMANETPVVKERTVFLRKLSETARSVDPTRLVSAAMETHVSEEDENIVIVNDPAAEFFDIVSFNQYFGWYNRLPHEISDVEFRIDYNKPVLVSEFGGGAKAGYRGDSLTRWTEDYQAFLYEKSLEMLEKIDKLSGMTPWLLVDFRSPRRPLAEIQEGYNRKGLISERGEKKQAFYILSEYYKKKTLINRHNPLKPVGIN